MPTIPIWLELEHGYSAGIGTLQRGQRGFFVLGRRTSWSDDHPRPMVAWGHFVDGRVQLTRGVLSESVRRELERRLRDVS